MVDLSERLLETLRAISIDGGSCPRGELREYVPNRGGGILPLVREALATGVLRTNHDMWVVTEIGDHAVRSAARLAKLMAA